MLRLILTHPLNRGHSVSALARYFGWQAWRRVVRRPLTVRFWGSLKIRVYPDWPYSWTAIYLGLTEYDDMLFTLKYLRPGDAFVDVGANIGYYSLLASSVNDRSPILAYEPHPTGSMRLSENARLNGFDNLVVRQVALGDESGVVRLTADLVDENRIQLPDESVLGVEVSMTTLDGDLRKHNIDPTSVGMVKIDTEGFEARVLAGATELLDIKPGPVWLLEMSGLGKRYGIDAAQIDRLFSERGYKPLRYFAKDNSLLPHDPIQNRGNVLYAREMETVFGRLGRSDGFSQSNSPQAQNSNG